MKYFRLLLEHLAWIEHQFLSGIRDSRKAGSLWGVMRGVGRIRKSIHQSWLAKGLGLLCWGFKGVQQEIPREEASTLQIGSVAFLAGQCTSPQLHPCHRLFEKKSGYLFNDTRIYIYIYIYVCVCVCVCMWVNNRNKSNNVSNPTVIRLFWWKCTIATINAIHLATISSGPHRAQIRLASASSKRQSS